MLELLLAISILWLYPCAFVALDRFACAKNAPMQLLFIQEQQHPRRDNETPLQPLPLHELSLLAHGHNDTPCTQDTYLLAQDILSATTRTFGDPAPQHTLLILAQTRELAHLTLAPPLIAHELARTHKHIRQPRARQHEQKPLHPIRILLYYPAQPYTEPPPLAAHQSAAAYQTGNYSCILNTADLRQLAKKLNHIHIPSTRRAPLLTNNQN